MSVWSHWNARPDEIAATYPCDAHAPPRSVRLVRAVDVDAPPATVFRWVCQVKVAPYSYDWIDNLGRRSPRTLTPGADDLAVGQVFGKVFRIADFARDEHITAVTTRRAALPFGPVVISYVVRPGRLLGVLWARRDPRLLVLAPGDLVMMRKQLLNLRDLAQETP